MISHQAALRQARTACPLEFSSAFANMGKEVSLLRLSSRRPFHTSLVRSAAAPKESASDKGKKPLTPKERLKDVAERAEARTKSQEQRSAVKGSFAKSSWFGEELPMGGRAQDLKDGETSYENRNLSNMAQVLNPRPIARSRWQRRMVIRSIRRGGRLTKEMKIARTERSHLSRSHFIKTSMKKLAPLARQIAGKSIDDAIVQMRFSKKKAAEEVRHHLIQARNEAIAIKGMGMKAEGNEDVVLKSDPSEAPPLPHQTPNKTFKKSYTRQETDIYVAEAWTNRGPYGREMDYRARGRVNIMRPPYTGISVLLKEERTRTREKAEKEAKALRKRMGKNMWVQLPDRKITAQRQHLLW